MSDDRTAGFCEDMIGTSSSLFATLERAKRVAPTDCTVLICGETGTGKELLARGIHRASLRGRKPFVAVNCAAISRDLLESEIFGHVQGAFTTALRSREGSFQVAEGGTIFLDEVGELPLALQAKLLRVLQFKEFTPVGDSRVRRADVRVIGATNADLARMVRDGLFRQDLYYRLNVIQLRIPPLRERLCDIELLTRHFLVQETKRYGRDIEGISSGALRRLEAHHWPGNVRELENSMAHAVLMAAGPVIEEHDLPHVEALSSGEIGDFVSPLTGDGIDLQAVLRRIEAHYIGEALRKTSGNKNQAAHLLGLNRTTLVEKLKRAVPDTLDATG
ncbi:MAG: sigma 54-interacting transcriptional regulator [Deltaproteobacteria bacterium]|nr:sigma 54-interacting transcriptional regulator [Deltaproteobacteria bacterium]